MRRRRLLGTLSAAVAAALLISSPHERASAQSPGQTNLLVLAHSQTTRANRQELEQRLTNAATVDEKVWTLLALSEMSLRENRVDVARQLTDQALLLRSAAQKQTRQMIDILVARIELARGDFDGVLNSLVRWSERSANSPFHPIVARIYFRALVRAGSPLQALDYFRRNQQALTTPLSPQIEESLVELIDKLDMLNDAKAISSLSGLLLTDFPLTTGSRQAFVRLTEAECLDESTRQDTWQNTALREQIAKRLVRDYGARPDLRQLGLALMRVSESEMVPNVPVDSLSMEEKADLFKRAELLQSAWEYQPSFRILDYLVQAKEYDGLGFSRDKVLLATGRTLNQLERYTESARHYAELLRDYKNTRSGKLARERMQLSLHYARRYEEEIALLKSFATRKTALADVWNLFWAQYLNRNDADAIATSHKILTRARKTRNNKLTHRTHYWLARLYERSGAVEEAKREYERLTVEAATSHYSVLSRWRMKSLSDPEGASTAELSPSPMFTAFVKAVENPAPDENATADSALLSRLGLSEFAKLLFGFRLPKRIGGDSLLKFSKLAQDSERYKLGITMIDPFVSEALSKGYSETKLQQSLQESRAAWTVAFPRPYDTVVEPTASILGIGPGLIYSLVRTESLFNPEAVSNVGALGLMQIMPRTGLHIARLLADTTYATPMLAEENLNLVYGSWYMRRLIRYYRGNYLLAVAAYNAGPLAVDRWIRQNPVLELDEFLENIPYDQTYAYVPKIMSYMNIYSRLYGEKLEPLTVALPKALPMPDTSIEIF
jgi:tetratricopeptide (TPR) repeat protein